MTEKLAFSPLKKSLNYAEARREARKRFGENAEVRHAKGRISEHQYEVGVVLEGKFTCLGVGGTWARALDSVLEMKGE